MDIQSIQQYINKNVYFTLNNNFKYKIFLDKKYLNGDILTFPDKFNNPVSISLSEISFITISTSKEVVGR